jgi:hypothetical protein
MYWHAITAWSARCLVAWVLKLYIADNWSITASKLLDCSYCNLFETQSCNRFLTVTQTLVTLAVVNNGKLPHSPPPPLNCHNLALTANKNTNCFMCIIYTILNDNILYLSTMVLHCSFSAKLILFHYYFLTGFNYRSY